MKVNNKSDDKEQNEKMQDNFNEINVPQTSEVEMELEDTKMKILK